MHKTTTAFLPLRTLREALMSVARRSSRPSGDAPQMRIARHPASDTTEGWVEHISRSPAGAEIRLELPDGSTAKTCLPGDEMEWLELRVGQIVALTKS